MLVRQGEGRGSEVMGTSLRDSSSKGITGGLKVEVVPRWAVGETLLCRELSRPVSMDHFPHHHLL